MGNISIMPLDTFVVINRTILNDNDRKLLIALYQPIVGAISINLYFNLWNYLDKIEMMSETYEHKKLASFMGITLKELMEAREQLEGVGLIKTYLKEGEINNYVYELYSPVPAYDFFINPLLSTVLYTNVGATEYKKIKESFKLPSANLKDYQNVSKKFSDVFKSTSLIDINGENIKKKNYAHLGINSNIDVENIIMTIPDIMLNHTKVSSSTKDLIVKMSYVYDFDEEATLNIIKDSLNDRHNIDVTLLKNNYKNYYQFENNGKLPSIIYKTQPENLKKEVTSNSKCAKAIYLFENTSPYRFICLKSKTEKPTKTELEILEYLLVDMNLKPGVVNVLIDYVLKINNNKLTKNFVVAIASQWKRSNIELVEDAMNIAKQENKTKGEYKVKQQTKSIKEEIKPSWFDKNIEEEHDIDKQKEIEKMLSEV